MKFSAVEARARQNKLSELAGKSYRDRHSAIVSRLTSEGEPVYLGIQGDYGPYTIIGADHVFVSTRAGSELAVSHSNFLRALQATGMERGKGGEFEYIPVGEGHSFWVKDGSTMCALWNIVLALSRSRKDVVSDPPRIGAVRLPKPPPT